MKYSKRISHIQHSPIRKLTSFENTIKNKGIKVHHLNIGQPDIDTPHNFFEEIKNFNEDILKYSNSSGIPKLIESIIDYYSMYNINFKNEDILITTGASEALLFSILATCDSNDSILIPEPFYTNYDGFAKSLDVNIIPISTSIDNNFCIPSKESIIKLISDNTRAILICNPGNPTGYVYSKEDICMLADIAIENDLWIISDEVYREFTYDDSEFISFANIDKIKDRTIIIDSISKKYSACGARIGSIACKNKSLINEILKLCQNRLCVATLEQIGAVALYRTQKEYFKNINNEYKNRRDLLYNELIKIEGVVCKKPKGAFYILAKLPVEDSEDFSKWLLQNFSLDNETVMLCPAKGFYKSSNLGKNEVRISYVLNKIDLLKSINIIKKGLKLYNEKN